MNDATRALIGAIMRIHGEDTPPLLTRLALTGRPVIRAGNSQVEIELFKSGRKLAPISTPAAGGVIMTHTGYDKLVVETPLLAPKWDMTELGLLKAVGEVEVLRYTDGAVASVTTADRMTTWRGLRLREAVGMVRRRVEWMLAQQLVTGLITLEGEGGYRSTIDTNFTNTVQPQVSWDDPAATPITDLRAIQDAQAAEGLPISNHLVLNPDVAGVFTRNAEVLSSLMGNLGMNAAIFADRRPSATDPLARYVCYIPELDLNVWSYGATYDDGPSSPFYVPINTGVLFPDGARNTALMAYGAIRDSRSNAWIENEYYVREYSREDGHAEYLEVNSRPVACLCEVDSWASITAIF
jgi:hypothetical protein